MTQNNFLDNIPSWMNWVAIVGTAALAWIQPVAGIVAIVWGCLQIYGWVEKRLEKRRKMQYTVGAVPPTFKE